MKFLFTIFHSKAVSGVHNPDDCVGLLKVVSPVWTKRALAANIPCVLLATIRARIDDNSQIFNV